MCGLEKNHLIGSELAVERGCLWKWIHFYPWKRIGCSVDAHATALHFLLLLLLRHLVSVRHKNWSHLKAGWRLEACQALMQLLDYVAFPHISCFLHWSLTEKSSQRLGVTEFKELFSLLVVRFAESRTGPHECRIQHWYALSFRGWKWVNRTRQWHKLPAVPRCSLPAVNWGHTHMIN